VNVVPIIAKSDSLTMEERSAFKQKVKLAITFTCPTRSDYGSRSIERVLTVNFRVGSRRTHSPQHSPVPLRY
jgi:hypothetical protein